MKPPQPRLERINSSMNSADNMTTSDSNRWLWASTAELTRVKTEMKMQLLLYIHPRPAREQGDEIMIKTQNPSPCSLFSLEAELKLTRTVWGMGGGAEKWRINRVICKEKRERLGRIHEADFIHHVYDFFFFFFKRNRLDSVRTQTNTIPTDSSTLSHYYDYYYRNL